MRTKVLRGGGWGVGGGGVGGGGGWYWFSSVVELDTEWHIWSWFVTNILLSSMLLKHLSLQRQTYVLLYAISLALGLHKSRYCPERSVLFCNCPYYNLGYIDCFVFHSLQMIQPWQFAVTVVDLFIFWKWSESVSLWSFNCYLIFSKLVFWK